MAYEGTGTATNILTANAAGTLPNFQAPVTFTTGTFTPTIQIGGSSAGITYGGRTGEYSIIGNVVFYEWALNLTSKGGLGGQVTLHGFPVTIGSTSAPVASINDWYFLNISGGYNQMVATCVSATTHMIATQTGSTGASIDLDGANLNNNTGIQFIGFYFTT